MRGLEELVRGTAGNQCATDQSLQDVDSLRIAELDRGSGGNLCLFKLKTSPFNFFIESILCSG